MKLRSITILAVCQVAAMSLWFSASAVIPSILAEVALTDTQVSLFTSMVQAGFVVGTLLSAILGMADRLDPRRYFMGATLVAAAANASILLFEPGTVWVYAARFVTGMCMAGIYPVGMKMATTWAKGDLGILVAILVGALTLGSSAPHLFNTFGGVDWRFTIMVASLTSILAALAINLVQLGPRHQPPPEFSYKLLMLGFRKKSLRLANIGYLGHMWELYAMWAWIGIFLTASFAINSDGLDEATAPRIATFIVMGVGGFAGCLLGGYLSDRYGRTFLTIGAMSISGSCALIVGFFFGADPYLLTAICIVWGITIIADSAQFSAGIAELSEPRIIGTMLTIQTCAGFLLTLITIHLMPVFVDLLGWTYAFAPLAIGPLIGVWAMARLRSLPEASQMADGKR